MEEDKFKLNRSNIIFIVIFSILLIILIVVSVLLYRSFSKPIEGIPDLDITHGRTSTVSTMSTTMTTTTTTTTTTKALSSPYYTIDVDSILNSDLLTKQDLTRSEVTEVAQELYDFANKFYNINDNSLFDIKTTVQNAKSNEKDKIVIDGHNYGQMYNFEAIENKAFNSDMAYKIFDVEYDGVPVIIENDGSYYRLEGSDSDIYPIFASISLSSYNQREIQANISYYMSNYREDGYTAPVYKSVTITLRYDERWQIYSYEFPLYE